MNGGGPFKLYAGQVTDDSEMAISLLRGLQQAEWKFKLEDISYFYRKWFLTFPIDMGITTEKALSGPDRFRNLSLHEAMIESS